MSAEGTHGVSQVAAFTCEYILLAPEQVQNNNKAISWACVNIHRFCRPREQKRSEHGGNKVPATDSKRMFDQLSS